MKLSPSRKKLFRELCVATVPEEIAAMLEDGRPISRLLWNPYLDAAYAKTADAYAEGLLRLASAVLSEINRLESSAVKEEAESIRSLARQRELWPVMITRFPLEVEKVRTRVEKLGLGPETGRKKAPRKTTVMALGTRLLKLAKDSIKSFEAHQKVLTRISKKSSSDPSAPVYFGRKNWDFYYIHPSPPPLTQHYRTEWGKLGGVLLDIHFGTKDVRKKARTDFLEAKKRNPHQKPQRQFEAQGKVSDAHNLAESDPVYVKKQLTAWAKQDRAIANTHDHNSEFPHDPPPCLLGYAAMNETASKVRIGSKNRNALKSAHAIYNQIKKDVVNSFLNGLPKQ